MGRWRWKISAYRDPLRSEIDAVAAMLPPTNSAQRYREDATARLRLLVARRLRILTRRYGDALLDAGESVISGISSPPRSAAAAMPDADRILTLWERIVQGRLADREALRRTLAGFVIAGSMPLSAPKRRAKTGQ
jgi:hypothetical protein